jgi:hypothetical protein
MNTLKFHGLTSLTFAGAAIVLAAIAMFQVSAWTGIGYLLVCAVGATLVVYSFCAKCPCKAHCAHILPGKAAMLFKRRPGPYSRTESALTMVSLLLLIGLPLPALWNNPMMLVAFITLFIIAIVQVRSVVCRACGNSYCPFNKAKQVA